MNEGTQQLHDVSDGGLSGNGQNSSLPPILVGPSTGDEFNTVSLPLVPVACWRLEDIRFAFDSSFINVDPGSDDNPNDVRAELAHLQTLMSTYPGGPLSVFGHADPVGTDDYNKSLSGRRAMSVYALLVAHGEPSTAVSYWQQIAQAENWGADQQNQMQTFTNLPSGTSSASLIQTYLQKLCPPSIKLTKQNFLAQGTDPDRRGDIQGCSEFNPILIFSQERQAGFDQAKQANDAVGIAERNAANRPNRRVLVLVFRTGSVVLPGKWPCPAALTGMGVCKGRFWSDGESRRSTHLPGLDRDFTDNQDTFACRFYQRIIRTVPCETAKLGVATYIITDEADGSPVANTYFEVRRPNAQTQRVQSDAAGLIVLSGGQGDVFDLVKLDDPNVKGAVSQNGPPLTGAADAKS